MVAHRFDIGDVITKSFECFGRNWIRFVCLVGLITLPLLAVQILVVHYEDFISGEALFLENPDDPPQDEEIFKFIFAVFGVTFGIVLLSVVLQTFATAALVFGTFRDMRGGVATIGECLSAVFPRLPMLTLLSFVMGVVVTIGLMMCCVPGVIAWIFFYLVVPVAVVEKIGFDAFGRSKRLVEGYFWGIFALALLFVIGINGIGSSVIGQLFTVINPYAGAVATWLASLFGITLVGIAQTVSYHDLRVSKEGLVDEDIAAIFD